MRRRYSLVIRRDDHKGDALGAVFLGVVTDPGEIRGYVQRYLGPVVRVVKVVLAEAVLRVEAESSGFAVESQNLTRLGKAMLAKGRVRAASDMFAEALRLDPLNVDALKADASLRYRQGDIATAHDRWVRAAEVGGYDGEILRGLAAVALRQDRRPSAMRYLEEALVVNPEDEESRRLLAELRRQGELAFERGPGRESEKQR
jgi:tetratricopeptide (TPR) repeat protein